MTRRTISLLLSFVLLLLPGCQQQTEAGLPTSRAGTGPVPDPPSCAQVLSAVWGGGITLAEGSQIYDCSDREALSGYIQGAYGLAEGEWEDAAVARETGMSARETAVLRFADEEAAQRGEELLRDYLHKREKDFTGYAPAMARLAAAGVVCRQGLFAGLFIHEDGGTFQSALRTVLEAGDLPQTSPEAIHDASPEALVNEIWYALHEAGCAEQPMELSDPDSYMTDIVGIPKADYKKMYVLHSSGAFELAVLHCTDEEAAQRTQEKLRGGNGAILTEDNPCTTSTCRLGRYVGRFTCRDSALAEEAFLNLLENGFEPRRPASVTAQPAATLQDLLFCLLIEGGACPDWRAMSNAARSSVGVYGPKSIAWMFGPLPDQYENCEFAWWDTTGSILWSPTDSPNELVLFQTAGEREAKDLLPVLRATLETRREAVQEELDFYTSEEFDLQEHLERWPDFNLEDEVNQLARLLAGLENAQVVQSGRYALLLMCGDPAQAIIALPRFIASPNTAGFFERYIQNSRSAVQVTPDPNYPDRELFTPPNEEDMSIYDTSALLSAWEKGDPSGLSGHDKEIYAAAEKILDEIATGDMTDLEKETAVYAWLTANVDYDWSHMDVMAETARDAYGPYGGLVNRSAVCLGYAASFQLLMDMLGIDCVTVVGAGSHSTADHAWNVVKLDGKWYCVDAAWDANGREYLGGEYEWRYFNLTSDEMAEDHQWDYANVPEAVTQGNGA